MKKIILAISLCFLILTLVSCSVPYKFSQDISSLEEISIEIVELDEVIGNGKADYSEDKISVIRIVEDNEKEAFISEFKNIKSYEPLGEPITFISGTAIRITYPNGNMELITDFGVGKLSEGEWWISTISFEDKGFEALINKYYPEIESLTVDGAQIRDGYAILPLCSTLEALGFELERDGNGNASFTANKTEYLISVENKTLTANGNEENYLICPPGSTSFVCEAVDGELMIDEATFEALFNSFLNYSVQVYISGDSVLIIKR